MKDNPTLDIPRCSLKDHAILYIDSDGRATPCLPLWGRPDNPNVYDTDVKSAWEFYSDYALLLMMIQAHATNVVPYSQLKRIVLYIQYNAPF